VKEGDAECLYLTTTGRRTGQPREIEIWFTEHEGRYYVVAEHLEEAHFVQNLRADPRVQVRVGGHRFAASARVVDADREPALAETVRALSEKKYGWGDGLIVELSPGPDPGT
jgi:deazaflavin-dependent oxidoreductase (nitroreductase family)